MANATSILGVAVTSASAARSNKLTGDGTSIRFRDDIPDFRDWGPIGDGATSDTEKFREFMTKGVGPYGRGRIVRPSPNNLRTGYRIDDVVELHDTFAGDNLRGWRLEGDYGTPHYDGGGPHLITGVACPYGTAAALVRGYFGTGQATQVWHLGKFGTDYFNERVTTSKKDRFIGRPIRFWNVAALESLGEFIIVGVPDDDHVTVHNPRSGAVATDTNNGKIRWRIYLPTLDIRCRGWWLDGLKILSAPSPVDPLTGLPQKYGPIIEFTQQEHARDGLTVSQFLISGCTFGGQSDTSIFRNCIAIARDIVPRPDPDERTGVPTNPLHSVNGNGDWQVYQTVQVDEGLIWNCVFGGADEIQIAHYSSNGQSKSIRIERCSFLPGRRKLNLSTIGYGVPRDNVDAGGNYSSVGNPQVFLDEPKFNALDLCVLYGGSTSGGIKMIRDAYTETAARFIRDVSQYNVLSIEDCQLAFLSGFGVHPSKEIMFFGQNGPVSISRTNIIMKDGSGAHITQYPVGDKTPTARLVLDGVWLYGRSEWQGRRGRQVGRRCGPYKLSAGDTFQFQFNVSGITRTITLSATNFMRAGAGTINWDEVESWQLGLALNGSTRQGDAAYDVGAVIQPTTENGRSYLVTTGGKTDSVRDPDGNFRDPTGTWTTTVGKTEPDGTVVVTCIEGHNAWGEWDHHPPSVQSKTDGKSSAVLCMGGTGSAQTDFDTVAAGDGQARTQVSIDTNGFIDHHPGAGSGTEPVSFVLTVNGMHATQWPSVSTKYDFFEGKKEYGTANVRNTYVVPYVWDGLVADLARARVVGPNVPTLATFRGTIEAYSFSASMMNEASVTFHVDHRIKPGSKLYLRIHWAPSDTNRGVCRWGIEYTAIAGHSQGAFPASATLYLEQVASGTDRMHQIIEDTNGIGPYEPDTLIVCRIFRDATHPNDTYNAGAFGLVCDLRYQVDRAGTLNKAPNFYG